MKKHRKPLSRYFPAHHPRKGEPTYFVEKIYKSIYLQDKSKVSEITIYSCLYENMLSPSLVDASKLEPKHHTIRAGHNVKVGDTITFYVWSGKPYRSKQIVIAPPIEVKKVWDFELTFDDLIYIDGKLYAYSSSEDAIEALAKNDGLSDVDLLNWFKEPFEGQIICWNDQINY